MFICALRRVKTIVASRGQRPNVVRNMSVLRNFGGNRQRHTSMVDRFLDHRKDRTAIQKRLIQRGFVKNTKSLPASCDLCLSRRSYILLFRLWQLHEQDSDFDILSCWGVINKLPGETLSACPFILTHCSILCQVPEARTKSVIGK